MRSAAAIGVATTVAACTAVHPPGLELAAIERVDRSDDGAVMYIVITARNDNHFELPLHSLQYTVQLDGRSVFRTTRSPEATLPQLGEQRLRIPVVVPAQALRRLGASARFELDALVRYRRPGQLAQVLYDWHLYRPAARLRAGGLVELPPPDAP